MSVKTFTRRDGRIVTVDRSSGKRIVTVQTVFQSGELSIPTHRAVEPPPCVHLGEPTGGIMLIECDTCRGRVRRKMPVNICAALGTCLPGVRGEHDGAAGCSGCTSYSAG